MTVMVSPLALASDRSAYVISRRATPAASRKLNPVALISDMIALLAISSELLHWDVVRDRWLPTAARRNSAIVECLGNQYVAAPDDVPLFFPGEYRITRFENWRCRPCRRRRARFGTRATRWQTSLRRCRRRRGRHPGR